LAGAALFGAAHEKVILDAEVLQMIGEVLQPLVVDEAGDEGSAVVWR